jgi:hypothetical protein
MTSYELPIGILVVLEGLTFQDLRKVRKLEEAEGFLHQ